MTTSENTSEQVVELSLGQLVLPAGEVRVRDGSVRRLTPTESALVSFLLDQDGRAVLRQTLMSRVWGYAEGARSRTLDTTVKTLRRKIEEDPRQPAHLRTVHGVGYRMVVYEVCSRCGLRRPS